LPATAPLPSPTSKPTATVGFIVPCALAILLAGGPPATAGQGEPCPVTYRPDLPIMVGSTIRLELAVGVSEDLVASAVGMWRECPGYGESFPRFVTDGEGDMTLTVRRESRTTGAAHCAYIGRREIVLFDQVRTHDGVVLSCGRLEPYLAHELGHVLGLADQKGGRRCQPHVMAPILEESLARARPDGRRVQPAECRAADQRWLTGSELASHGTAPSAALSAHLERQGRDRPGVELAGRLLGAAQPLGDLPKAQLLESAQQEDCAVVDAEPLERRLHDPQLVAQGDTAHLAMELPPDGVEPGLPPDP
jgi:hypothetical protein